MRLPPAKESPNTSTRVVPGSGSAAVSCRARAPTLFDCHQPLLEIARSRGT